MLLHAKFTSIKRDCFSKIDLWSKCNRVNGLMIIFIEHCIFYLSACIFSDNNARFLRKIVFFLYRAQFKSKFFYRTPQVAASDGPTTVQ